MSTTFDALLPTTTESLSTDVSEIQPMSHKDRQNSLEKALQQRPDIQDLKASGILLDTNVAP